MSRVYGNRALLNLPGQQTIAAIVAELENLNGYWCATLQLSDCDRKVSFSLPDPSNCSDAEFENAMYKLDTIVNSVKELQRGMRSVWRRS